MVLNTRTLATPGSRRRAKASSEIAAPARCSAGARGQVLVGDAGVQAAGEMGRLLAADRQGRGADGIEPVDTRG